MPIYKMKGTRDGLQKYRVRVNYVDAHGASRQADRVVYGLEEAKALELQLTQSIKNESPARRLTLRELFDEYKAIKKHEVRESTLDKTSRIIECHVMPLLEKTRLNKLNMQTLTKWKLAIEGKQLSLISKRNIFTAFRALLNYAVKMDYIPQNLLTRVGNFKSSDEHKKDVDYYTAAEYKKVYQSGPRERTGG